MRRFAITILSCLLVALGLTINGAAQDAVNTIANSAGGWQKLADGLELGIFDSPQAAEIGDSKIRILRIDPGRYELKLLNASVSNNGHSLSAKQWCRQNGLVAAINASMFQADFKTSVSLMRTRTHVNNPRFREKDKSILAFDRLGTEVPEVKIIDRECENFKIWKYKYGTLIQSIRMLSCKGKNVWQQQPKKWSTAAIGMDKADRVLFIHVGSPYSTHDLIDILKQLPIEITRAMYTEGGSKAQLYIKTGVHEYEFTGHSEIDFNNNAKSLFSLPIPNVVGVSLRKD
ncbi:MAG: phosphodiester glycosidase family protein [Desulfobacteraceae bacterium]|nr:phosphodiester glycosidase family protein [Desulfobacteraceae bacterium]